MDKPEWLPKFRRRPPIVIRIKGKEAIRQWEKAEQEVSRR